MKLVNVRVLDRVEDARRHPVLDANGAPQIDDASGELLSVYRVDRFAAGARVSIPDYQARHLVALGKAVIDDGSDPAPQADAQA